MYITWLGHSSFKIQGKDVIVVTDPYDSKMTGLTMPRLTANIVTVSHDHLDHNNIKAIKGDPLVIDMPGEYESRGVGIQGIASWHDPKEGTERGDNIIFIYEVDGIKIAHLGDLGCALSDEQIEKIDGIDILLIPVGGVYTINGKQAAEAVSRIEPRIVIPMHYKIPGLKIKLESVDSFCKEMGIKQNNNILDKLKINKKDLPVEDTKVILLKL